MKVVRILFFVSLQFVVPFEAQAVVFGQERGAGHEVALAFRKAFEVALKDLQRKGFSREDHDKLLATANGAKYLVVEGPLYVSTADGVQVATAVNDVKAQSISIDFKRWDGITDAQIASALALHEVASLAGLEGTGKYTLSAAYICEDKLSPPTNVQDPRLKDFVNNYRDELGKVLDSAPNIPGCAFIRDGDSYAPGLRGQCAVDSGQAAWLVSRSQKVLVPRPYSWWSDKPSGFYIHRWKD